jgi:hypothetical protein
MNPSLKEMVKDELQNLLSVKLDSLYPITNGYHHLSFFLRKMGSGGSVSIIER